MESEAIVLADPEFVRELPDGLQRLARSGMTPAGALEALRRSPAARANVEALYLLSHALGEAQRVGLARRRERGRDFARTFEDARRHFRHALSDLLFGLGMYEFNRACEARGLSFESRLLPFRPMDGERLQQVALTLRALLRLESDDSVALDHAILDALPDNPIARCRGIMREVLRLGAQTEYASYYLTLLDSFEDPASIDIERWSEPAGRLPQGELRASYLFQWATALDKEQRPRDAVELDLAGEVLYPGAVNAPARVALHAFACGEKRIAFQALERWFERWWPSATLTQLYREQVAGDRGRWSEIFRTRLDLQRLLGDLPRALADAIGGEVL